MDILAAVNLVAAGQSRAAGLLAAMSAGARLPHALLFTGPDGAGKEFIAVKLAAMLVCDKGDACGGCPACRRVSRLEHPDLHLVYAVPSGELDDGTAAVIENRRTDFLAGGELGNRARSIGIDAVRRISERVSRRPFEGKRSVTIVFEAHLATAEAQNALLKILEEPPPSAAIVLVTQRADRLLPTIVSRCREIRFDPLPDGTVAEYLSTFHSVSGGEARRLAARAEGNLRRAAKFLDERFLGQRRDAAALLRLALVGPARLIPGEAETAARTYTREETLEMLDEMAAILRGLIRAECDEAAGREAADEIGPEACAAAAGRDLAADIRSIAECARNLRRNADMELALAQLLLALAGKWY